VPGATHKGKGNWKEQHSAPLRYASQVLLTHPTSHKILSNYKHTIASSAGVIKQVMPHMHLSIISYVPSICNSNFGIVSLREDMPAHAPGLKVQNWD